jgi:hypothetical protein
MDDVPCTQFDDKIDETQQEDEVPGTQPQKMCQSHARLKDFGSNERGAISQAIQKFKFHVPGSCFPIDCYSVGRCKDCRFG